MLGMPGPMKKKMLERYHQMEQEEDIQNIDQLQTMQDIEESDGSDDEMDQGEDSSSLTQEEKVTLARIQKRYNKAKGKNR